MEESVIGLSSLFVFNIIWLFASFIDWNGRKMLGNGLKNRENDARWSQACGSCCASLEGV